jgi:hypothetical protein
MNAVTPKAIEKLAAMTPMDTIHASIDIERAFTAFIGVYRRIQSLFFASLPT